MRGLSSSRFGRFTSLTISLALALAPVVFLPGEAAAGEPAGASPPDADSAAAPQVVREASEKRRETSKHYLMSDGSYRAVISEAPVHFKDSSGKWADIDTELA